MIEAEVLAPRSLDEILEPPVASFVESRAPARTDTLNALRRIASFTFVGRVSL